MTTGTTSEQARDYGLIGTDFCSPRLVESLPQIVLDIMLDFVRERSVAGYAVELVEDFHTRYYEHKTVFYLVVAIEGYSRRWIDHGHRFTAEELIHGPRVTLDAAWAHAAGHLPLPKGMMAL